MMEVDMDYDGFVYLKVVREGDSFLVVDQNGRKVQGITSISVDCGMDHLTSFSITAFDYNKENMPHVNKK